MKINIKKILVFLIILILINFSFMLTANAEEKTDDDLYSSKMGELIKGDWSDATNASNKVSSILTTIIVAVKISAIAIAIIMLLVVAMKYVASAPGDRADIKKSAIVYVVGAFVLFGVSGILSIIEKVSRVINISENE